MRGTRRYCLYLYVYISLSLAIPEREASAIGAKERIEDQWYLIDKTRGFHTALPPVRQRNRGVLASNGSTLIFPPFFFCKSLSAQGEEVTQRVMRDLQRNSRPCCLDAGDVGHYCFFFFRDGEKSVQAG